MAALGEQQPHKHLEAGFKGLPGILVGIAALCASLVLLGWFLGVERLTDFGRAGSATSPLTALCFLLVALALAAELNRRSRLALGLVAPPLLVAAFALLARAGDGEPLQSFALSAVSALLPSPMAAAQLLLLGAAILLSLRDDDASGKGVVVLATLAIALALVAGTTSLLFPAGNLLRNHYVTALPNDLIASAIALALLLRCGARQHLVAAGTGEGTVPLVVLPAALLIPVVAGILEHLAVSYGLLSSPAAWLAGLVLVILFIAALLFWASSRLEREQRVRRALLRAMDSAPIVLTTMNGRILHWSQGCEQLYGWSAEEARGRIKHELLASRGSSGGDWADGRPVSSPSWEEEVVERRRDGAVLHILEQGRTLEARYGGEPVLVLSMTDITARKAAETALRESEARLSLAMDTLNIGVMEYDPATGAMTWSDGVEGHLGLPSGALHGAADWMARIDPADREAVLEGFRESIAQKRSHSRFRHRIGAPNARRTIEGAVRYMYDSEGHLDRIVGVGTDVTERVQSEARVASLQEEVARVSRISAMGEMASGLAHELNQPLAASTTYIGVAQHLLGKADTEQATEVLRLANAQVLRAGEIIRRMRSFVSDEPAEMRREPVREVIEESVALATTITNQHEVRVMVAVDSTTPRMLADRIQVQQVLLNLIKNAAEALGRTQPEDPWIMVRARPDGGMIRFTVEDNGPGISSEVAPRLFDPFVSGKADGMGLGLSICRRIVEAHGGKLQVTNNRSGGATFWFTLPSEETTRLKDEQP